MLTILKAQQVHFLDQSRQCITSSSHLAPYDVFPPNHHSLLLACLFYHFRGGVYIPLAQAGSLKTVLNVFSSLRSAGYSF